MLFPFPSNKLVSGSTVFFKWKDNLYAYGTVERVVSNNRSVLEFPLNGKWDNEVYPYFVKFLRLFNLISLCDKASFWLVL
jgi:hypothetical protein